jgi:hypothetical protein
MSTPTLRCLRAALLSLLFIAGLSAPAGAVLIYFGVSDVWQDLVTSPNDWTFVQQHADGFYVNFLMLNRAAANIDGLSQLTLAKTCRLFSTHNAYIESDMRPVEATLASEQQYIEMLHAAGCKVEFSSLNFGWSAQRAYNLSHFDLLADEGRRLNFVQTGPWLLNGSIDAPSIRSRPGYNAQIRADILASDGVSTDNPLGFWAEDFLEFRGATVSLIQHAHHNGRSAVIVISPYGANMPLKVYNAATDLLPAGQQEVRYLESELAIPDIWAISQYATNLTPIPEQSGGLPADTVSGLAYWLIQHVHDPDGSTKLSLTETGPTKDSTNLVLRNDSKWLDVAPLLRLRVRSGSGLAVALLLDGRDVTAQAMTPAGLALVGRYALDPGDRHDLAIAVSRNGARAYGKLALEDGRAVPSAQQAVILTLAPNPGVPNEIHQSVMFSLAGS